jgi:hypothetical protein
MQIFIEAAVQTPSWNWYAIADSAQHRDLPGALVRHSGGLTRCLFDAPPGSPLAANSPHLVQLERPTEESSSWKWIRRNANGKPCVTVIASDAGFDTVFAHLQQFIEVLLPDGEDMFFAFWDPAILGVLVGQSDDPTLYVRGPVLNVPERATLTQGIAGWWHWDRNGALRSLDMTTAASERAKTPLQLTQQQMDDLVEASMPDQLLHNINQNRPHLFNDAPNSKRYSYVTQMLPAARQIGLEGMRDLTNFVCLGLIYKERFMTDPEIRELLMQVQQKLITMDKAMEQMP